MSKRDLELIDNSGGDAGNANRHNRFEVMSKTAKSIEFFAFQVDRSFYASRRRRRIPSERMGAKRDARSRAWGLKQAKDPYVAAARAQGFRSRAAFKLEQLDKKDRLFRKGMNVIDLGAAPGSWSQYAVSKVGSTGRVIALDRLKMASIPGVSFIYGDFLESTAIDEIRSICGEEQFDLVISDMAPNLTGIKDVDQAAMGELVAKAAVFAQGLLHEKGVFVAKFFEGVEAKHLISDLTKRFRSCRVRKPQASRAESAEVYVIARNPI